MLYLNVSLFVPSTASIYWPGLSDLEMANSLSLDSAQLMNPSVSPVE